MAETQAAYRSTGDFFVCAPTNHFKDLAALESFVKDCKQHKVPVPAQVEAALEAAKSGRNLEESLNIACDGLFNFYMREETRCARQAGFSSLDDMYRRRGNEWQQVEQIYDPCIASVVHRLPLTNIDYTLNLANPESLASQFLARSKKQVMDIVSKYVKRSVLQKAKAGPPPYERTRP